MSLSVSVCVVIWLSLNILKHSKQDVLVVSLMYLRCSEGVFRIFKECAILVLKKKVVQGCFKDVFRVVLILLKVFQGCLKGVLTLSLMGGQICPPIRYIRYSLKFRLTNTLIFIDFSCMAITVLLQKTPQHPTCLGLILAGLFWMKSLISK